MGVFSMCRHMGCSQGRHTRPQKRALRLFHHALRLCTIIIGNFAGAGYLSLPEVLWLIHMRFRINKGHVKGTVHRNSLIVKDIKVHLDRLSLLILMQIEGFTRVLTLLSCGKPQLIFYAWIKVRWHCRSLIFTGRVHLNKEWRIIILFRTKSQRLFL